MSDTKLTKQALDEEAYDAWFRCKVEEALNSTKPSNPHVEVMQRLIAAAPDMYEALRNLENDDNHMPDSAWRMVQDAIAKAEGKE